MRTDTDDPGSPGSAATAAHDTPDPVSVHRRLLRLAGPLVLNTGLNGLLGVVYWVVAARLYDEASVAAALALVSAMTTLSGLSQLNLGPSLGVLVPRAGARGLHVVRRTYGVVTAYSLVLTGGFVLLVLPRLSGLSDVLDSPAAIALFVLGVLAFNLFALQDAALAALRRTFLVPIENGLFGAAKIALLPVLTLGSAALGMFFSWVLPMLVLVPAISLYIFTRRPARRTVPLAGRPRDTVSTLGLDYFGYLFQVAATFFLPVVALELLSPVEAAIFGVAWMTSGTIDLVATNIGTALTVETSYGTDPVAMRRTILRRVVPLVAAGAVVGILASPLILRLYGAGYAAEGTWTLGLLMLAGVPRCLVTFAIAECRAQGRIPTIVWLRAQNAVLTLGLSVVLAPGMGMEGMAVAWLVAQCCGALTATGSVWLRPVGGRATR